ncbi:hypothetical protein NL64_26875 [Pseudomonas fluorescens]|nr:hypothetical protein NL64_26875 [Pseudomonas fluorescens]
MPSTLSEQRTRIITRVWICMLCIANLCGRMVGRSTMFVSSDAITVEVVSIPIRFFVVMA